MVDTAPPGATAAPKPKPLHLQNKPPMFSDMASLSQARSDTHSANVDSAAKAMDEEFAEDPSFERCPREAFVTAQDQTLVCKVYETRIAAYVRAFKFDDSEAVHATAVSLFKRFYLKQAIFNYDPKIILMTCIFLASKIENSYLELKDILAKVPASQRPSEEVIKETELVVADTIGFQFMVHQVKWPLHGLFLDLQTYFASIHQSQEPRKQAIQNLVLIYNRACELAKIAISSDLQFTHYPSQIALGSFLMASTELDLLKSELNQYISYRIDWVDVGTIAALHTKLEGVADAIKAQQEFEKLAKDTKSVVSQKAKEVAAKLTKCMNPEY
ncbi:cyclin-like protein [Rhizoclosmatium globosum]|uniref:Cyclin-like protein n=1 Tax=Rhizoclosmatium globosum TaxID=329046 RepID=A0A1Y2CVW4_9FUNG|nr:cyclin-like protein [Rhizoclosmatium globosum]|eukprot:ORY50475.1 cyclin-like protein [Rhizoclosmatium globosum]